MFHISGEKNQSKLAVSLIKGSSSGAPQESATGSLLLLNSPYLISSVSTLEFYTGKQCCNTQFIVIILQQTGFINLCLLFIV